MDSTFRSYYTGFLGAENAEQIIFPCKRRAEPFSLFFSQYLIATFIDSGPVISVNPNLLSVFNLPDSAYQRKMDIRNTPSVKLAESIGYREASREVIVSGYYGITLTIEE